MTKEQTQDLLQVATTAFAVYSVVRMIREAGNDDDGLQMTEALLRGAAVTLSVIILVRNLRQERAARALAAGGSTA